MRPLHLEPSRSGIGLVDTPVAPLTSALPEPSANAAMDLGSGEANPWRVIIGVGGLCWLAITGTAILWMWPYSGTVMDGSYVMTSGARTAQHFADFMLAVPAYRLSVALGWPNGMSARLRVAGINLMLAAAVVGFSSIGAALATGFLDGRRDVMSDTLHLLAISWPHLQFWMAPLRFFLPPYVLGLCAVALVLVARRQNRESLRAAELGRAYSAARMATLSAQLQPHFLFNSLNSISALIDESPRQAATMVARLGDFLRYALENTHWPWVDLETELKGLEAYLEVQRVRFAECLSITIEASEASLGVYIPSLLLQPVAENAIEHGRMDGARSLDVSVVAAIINDRLLVRVNNSSPRLAAPLSPSDYGQGLANVALRLQAAYEGEARMSIGPGAEPGTTATLDLPLRSASQLGLASRHRR